MNTNIYFRSYLAQFFLWWEIFRDKSWRENQNTFCFQRLSFRKSCRLLDNVGKCCRAGQAKVDNMAHARYLKLKITNSQYVIFIAFPLQQSLN